MPLTFTKEHNGMTHYIHDGPNLYLTADDQVVEEGDTRAATLLVAHGGTLPPEQVARYGLARPIGSWAGYTMAAAEPERHEIQPRELAPGEMLRAGDLPPDAQVLVVRSLSPEEIGGLITSSTFVGQEELQAASNILLTFKQTDGRIEGQEEERPDDASPGEQIDGQGLEPVVEFTPSAKFEEEVNEVADQEKDEKPADEGEKAKPAKPNKAKGPPTQNKAG